MKTLFVKSLSWLFGDTPLEELKTRKGILKVVAALAITVVTWWVYSGVWDYFAALIFPPGRPWWFVVY